MKKLLYPVAAFLFIMVLVLGWSLRDYYTPNTLENPATILLAPGTHFNETAQILGDNQIIRQPLLFKAALLLSGASSHIKAGEYAFPAHVSPHDALALLVSGKTVIHHLTIPEGLMTSEILEILRANTLLAGEVTLDVKEGELLPETYYFSRNDKRNDMLQRMRHAMGNALEEAWQGRADHLPFTDKQQALILASIVEKETGVASERVKVSAVYINRLNKNMLLQADPTTAYAVTGGKAKLLRPLTTKDLASDSPYNTYKFIGLPPAPISNPGKATLLATVHPESSDDLYFVATGTGGHNFARTMAEHNANVKKYRELKNAASH